MVCLQSSNSIDVDFCRCFWRSFR